MPEPTPEDRRAAANAGFFGHTAGFLSALAGYLKARFQLAGLEAKEAAIHYAIIVALLVGSLVVVVFGYMFLWMAIVFAITWFIPAKGSWIWVTFVVALLHFGAAAAAVIYAKVRLGKPMFTATLDEFRKDQEWLTPTVARPR